MEATGETAVLPDATQGRLSYLQRTSLAPSGYEWLQRPILHAPDYDPDPAADIQRGFDFLVTRIAFQAIRIPAGMLGPGIEPFDEVVRFVGAPLADSVGAADTIMERLQPAVFGQTVRTQLVGFGNVIAEPIELRGSGELAGRYHIYVTLSPTVPSYGEATYFSDDEAGTQGWVDSKISLAPLFEFRRVDGGGSFFVDTGATPIPHFPMDLTSDSSRWTRRAPEGTGLRWPVGESLHYPESVLILAQERATAVDPAEVKKLLYQIADLPPNHPDGVQQVKDLLPQVISACGKDSPT